MQVKSLRPCPAKDLIFKKYTDNYFYLMQCTQLAPDSKIAIGNYYLLIINRIRSADFTVKDAIR